MNDFSLFSMVKQGWPVLSILLAMSVISTAVFIDRWLSLRRTRCEATQFIRQTIRVIKERGLEAALAYCGKYRVPVAAAALAVLEQSGDRSTRERALEHAIQLEIHQLGRGVAMLGTIASTAPFVGLFGTVVGIIKAFANIAVSTGGGAEVVSAGIAEALVTTACGLLVAIPSVIYYNYCAHAIKHLAQETDLAVYELIAWLCDSQDPAAASGKVLRQAQSLAKNDALFR
jgi:biopolymer transport protein ExbB/biopolymer transport protein TolQ